MKHGKRKANHLLALVLSLCVLIPATGSLTFAAPEESGLCEHHKEHTQDCGYQEAQEGKACTHEHDETCGYTEEGGESSCTHIHDESCGYVEAKEGSPCTFECEICSNKTEDAEEGEEIQAFSVTSGDVYQVGSEEELAAATEAIKNSSSSTATLELTADVKASFPGVEGKAVTVTSAEDCTVDKGYTFTIAKELVGALTLDHVYVKTNENFAGIFANGHKFETTDQFQGEISHLYGGSSMGKNVTGGTQIVWKGGKVSWLYGGGLDSNVAGDVQITIDGKNADIENLFGGGRAQDTGQGRVDGNVTIDFRQGKTRSAFGGGENRNTGIKDKDVEPASVTGTVTFNMGYEGAPAESVWPGTAMYSYGGSYHSTVGNVVLNITDGVTTENDAGDRNIFACGYSDTVRGTVRVNVLGSPDILGGFIYAGGNTEAGIYFAETSVQILNENNDEYAVRVTYDVPKELESEPTRHGVNLGSKSSIPTTINGNALIELKSGNMDFLILDNETADCLTVNGNTELCIGEGRVAQVQGNKKEYDSDETDHTTTVVLSGESEIGYFYRFDEVALIDGANVLADATKFSQFGGSTQKPFFSVDNLFVGKDANFTTQNNGQARVLSGVVLQGTWEQRYCSGISLTDDDARTSADLRIGGSMEVDGGRLVSRGTTHVYNSLRAKGGVLVFGEPAIIGMSDTDKGRVFSVDKTKIYLPVIGTSESYYPTGNNLIRLAVGEKATGTADVYLFEGDDYNTPATIIDGHIGQNYINGQREISDAAFTLMADGYYFKRVEDSKTAGTAAYDMWQIAKESEQPWYYEVYYEYIKPNTNEVEWILHDDGQGGKAFPNSTVTIDHTSFDGDDLGWEDITGEQNEKLGTHYVYDADYPDTDKYRHRLSALCKEATEDNPLKIYYRANLNEVIYEYEGIVPEGADELLPKMEKKPYYSSVKVADAPTLKGYEFSGWKIKSPDYTKVENGAFTMPNEKVTLVGSWTKVEEPATVTLIPQDMTAYTGGNSISGDNFPSVRYQIDTPDNVKPEDITFSVDGKTCDVEKAGDYYLLSDVANTFVPRDNSTGTDAAENDAAAGVYDIGVSEEDTLSASVSGTTLNVDVADEGTLTVRNVSEPEKVVSETVDIAQPVVTESGDVNTDDGIGMAVIPEDTEFYTNGNEDLGLLGDNDSHKPQIALLFDDILPGEQDQDTKQLLTDRADKAGYSLTDNNSEFKYLDLINENDGNAWVSANDGSTITVYWPCPAGVDADKIDAEVLHFKGLHREYRGDIEKQVANCEVEVIKAEVKGDNIVFQLEGNQAAGSFSPFAIHWTRSDAQDTPEKPETPDDDKDITDDTVNVPDDKGDSPSSADQKKDTANLAAKTGDNNHIAVWLVLLGVSGAGLAVTCLFIKRKKS